MRLVAIALLLSIAACDDGPVSGGGTGGEVAGDSSDGGSTDAESSGGESSTGGAAWDGATLTLRVVGGEPSRSCDHSCGASACLGAENEWQSFDCDDATGSGLTCTCVDDAELVGTAPTHAVSDCYLGSDVPPPSGFDMGALEQWSDGSCKDFCADSGLGRCAWTQWTRGTAGCYEVGDVSQSGGLVLQYGAEMTVRTPFGVEDGGRLRFVCEV